jgi:hypothetical protein
MMEFSKDSIFANRGMGLGIATSTRALDQQFKAIPREKFSGNIWWDAVTNTQVDWLSRTTRLLSEPPNTVKIKKEELQKAYGNEYGYNFKSDMSEERAKFLIDDYKTQLMYKNIAENFGGDPTVNAFNFGLATLVAGIPSAILEEIAVAGLSAGVGAVTEGVGGVATLAAGSTALWGRRIFKAAEAASSVLKPLGRVLDSGSDLYKNRKFLGMPRETLHGAGVVNGLSSLVNAGTALYQGADVKDAALQGLQQFGTGLALAPAVHYGFKAAAFGSEKLGVTPLVRNTVQTVKKHIDTLLRVDKAYPNEIKGVEAYFDPTVVKDITNLTDTALERGVALDTTKPIIASVGHTVGDVIDAADTAKNYTDSLDNTIPADTAPATTTIDGTEPSVQPTVQDTPKNIKLRTKLEPVTTLDDFLTLEFDTKGYTQLHIIGERMGELAQDLPTFDRIASVISEKFQEPKRAKQQLIEGAARTVDTSKIDGVEMARLVGVEEGAKFYNPVLDNPTNKQLGLEQALKKQQAEVIKPFDPAHPSNAKGFVAKEIDNIKGKNGAKKAVFAISKAAKDNIAASKDALVTAPDAITLFKADVVAELKASRLALEQGTPPPKNGIIATEKELKATEEFFNTLTDEEAIDLATALGDETILDTYNNYLECRRLNS